jgi:hypothetical protein
VIAHEFGIAYRDSTDLVIRERHYYFPGKDKHIQRIIVLCQNPCDEFVHIWLTIGWFRILYLPCPSFFSISAWEPLVPAGAIGVMTMMDAGKKGTLVSSFAFSCYCDDSEGKIDCSRADQMDGSALVE